MTVQIGYKEPPLRPIIFGELCLLERISVGGMAEVYRAKPLDAPEFDRLFAVKRILPNLAEDDEFVQMFVDEAKIAIRLNHPNIAQIYELGKRGSSHYIVMEYVAGHDLLRLLHWYRLKRRTPDPQLTAYVMRCIASALGHAHEHRSDEGELLPVIHRDVSPANVLISYGGEVKLIDFGIAKIANRSSGTQVGVLKGKFSYMSPEQVAGKPVDPRSDLFSLGIVFHELLTGQRLFASANDFETLERVRDARVEPPSHISDAVPWQLDNIVMRLLAREPDARYASGSALVEAIDDYLHSHDEIFDQEALSNFMVEAFSFELAKERRRRERYAEFVTAEQVQQYNDRLLAEIEAQARADRDEPVLPEEEVETTRVVDANYDRLLSELDHGELERGKEQRVLAESRLGRLSRLLAHSDAVLASMDLPEPREHDDAPEELFRPQRSRRRPGVVILVAGALLLAAGAALWTLGPGRNGSRPAAPPGMVMLESEPDDDLQVFLDGRLVGTGTPLVVRDVSAGDHVLELRHDDFQTYRAPIAIEGGRALQRRVVLAREPRGVALADLRIDPPAAEVWLNGALLDRSASQSRLQLEARRPHLIEVRHPDFYVAERWLELDAGAHEVVTIALEPVAGRLSIRSEPPGTVVLDGVSRGSTGAGLIIEGLDPTVPHRLRIEPSELGFLPYETVLLFDGLRELNLFPTLRRLGEPVTSEPTPVGFLAVDTGERWFRVLVDGHDTGQTTPVTGDAPLALRVGVREISLVRGDERHELRVDVGPGATTVVDCRSPDRDCGI